MLFHYQQLSKCIFHYKKLEKSSKDISNNPILMNSYLPLSMSPNSVMQFWTNQNISSTFDYLKHKFKCITELEVGDKLGCHVVPFDDEDKRNYRCFQHLMKQTRLNHTTIRLRRRTMSKEILEGQRFDDEKEEGEETEFNDDEEDVHMIPMTKKTLYIDKQSLFQVVRRWYYNQNRFFVIGHIKELMKEYYMFLEVIYHILNVMDTNSFHYKIGDELFQYTKKIIQSFNVLKETYKDCPEMKVEIESIQKKLKEYTYKFIPMVNDTSST